MGSVNNFSHHQGGRSKNFRTIKGVVKKFSPVSIWTAKQLWNDNFHQKKSKNLRPPTVLNEHSLTTYHISFNQVYRSCIHLFLLRSAKHDKIQFNVRRYKQFYIREIYTHPSKCVSNDYVITGASILDKMDTSYLNNKVLIHAL